MRVPEVKMIIEPLSPNDWSTVFALWKNRPEIKPVIGIENEEGFLYISQDKHLKLAVFKNGLFLNSIALNYIPDYSFCFISSSAKVNDNNIFSKTDYVSAKSAMVRNYWLHCVGWSDERLYYELGLIKYDEFVVPSTGVSLEFLVQKNIDSKFYSKILLHAFDAYKRCKDNLNERRSFKNIKCEYFDTFDDAIIKLALYISSVNPSLGSKWERTYLRQGERGNCKSSSGLELLLCELRELLVGLYVQNDARGNYDPTFDVEINALSKTIEIIEKESLHNKQNNNLHIGAMEVVKNKLLSKGVNCRTNKEEQAWVAFVAAAWGITQSQVCSVGKKVMMPDMIDSDLDSDDYDELPNDNQLLILDMKIKEWECT